MKVRVNLSIQFKSLSRVQLFVTPWTAARQASLSSPTPGVYPNPCPLSQWCHPTISASVVPFSCPQSFLASGSFQMSQLFASGGQSIEVSASTSVLPITKIFFSISLILYLYELVDQSVNLLWLSFLGICKPNHYTVHLTVLCVNYISVKLEEKQFF